MRTPFFTFCAIHAAASIAFALDPPPNDLCENAQLLEVGVPVQGTTRGATWKEMPWSTWSPPLLSPGVWYRARSDTNSIRLSITNATAPTGYGRYCGDCHDLQLQYRPCSKPGLDQFYLVTGFDSDFMVNLIHSEGCDNPDHHEECATPANDICANALPMALDEPVIVDGRGAQWDENPICHLAAANDYVTDGYTFPGVWYRIRGDGTQFTILTENSESGLFYMTLYSGNCDARCCLAHQADLLFGGVSWCSSPGADYVLHLTLRPDVGGGKSPTPRIILTSNGQSCSIPAGCLPSPPPPANNRCIDAIPITGLGEFSFDNRGAHPSNFCQKYTPDVFYCWTAPADGTYYVDTCGLTVVPTALGVHRGCPCPLDYLDCTYWRTSDQCGQQSLTLPIAAVAGEQFSIMVSSKLGTDGGQGIFRITKDSPPALSLCALPFIPQEGGLRCACTLPGRWEAYESTRGVTEVVDDFRPTTTTGVNVGTSSTTQHALCWYGLNFDGQDECRRAVPDDFEVTYYADDCGIPGAVLAGPYSQSAGTLTVFGPAMTGGKIMDKLMEYQYAARHAPATLPSGPAYWLKITNTADGPCRWYWEAAAWSNMTTTRPGYDDDRVPILTDAISYQDGQSGKLDGFDPTDQRQHDMAFCLNSCRNFDEQPACLPVTPSERCAHLPGDSLCPDSRNTCPDPGSLIFCPADDKRFPAPPGDRCPDALPLEEGGTWFETTAATTDGLLVQNHAALGSESLCNFALGDEQIHRDVWFHYTPHCSGPVQLSLCGSDFDSKIAVYGSLTCPPPANSLLACGDDSCGMDPAVDAALTFNAVADQTYRVRVGGFQKDAGSAAIFVDHAPLPQVNLRHFALLSDCLNACGSPGCASTMEGCCGGVDFDGSRRIDLADLAEFTARMLGP